MGNEKLHPIAAESMMAIVEALGTYDLTKNLRIEPKWYLDLGRKIDAIVEGDNK